MGSDVSCKYPEETWNGYCNEKTDIKINYVTQIRRVIQWMEWPQTTETDSRINITSELIHNN